MFYNAFICKVAFLSLNLHRRRVEISSSNIHTASGEVERLGTLCNIYLGAFSSLKFFLNLYNVGIKIFMNKGEVKQ